VSNSIYFNVEFFFILFFIFFENLHTDLPKGTGDSKKIEKNKNNINEMKSFRKVYSITHLKCEKWYTINDWV
jgi:hypothetical protein